MKVKRFNNKKHDKVRLKMKFENNTFKVYDMEDDTIIIEKKNINLTIIVRHNSVIIEKENNKTPHDVIKRKQIFYKDIKKYE
jgi:hypothetical protein